MGVNKEGFERGSVKVGAVRNSKPPYAVATITTSATIDHHLRLGSSCRCGGAPVPPVSPQPECAMSRKRSLLICVNPIM